MSPDGRRTEGLTDCGAVGVTFVKRERKHIMALIETVPPQRSLRKLGRKRWLWNINNRNCSVFLCHVMGE